MISSYHVGTEDLSFHHTVNPFFYLNLSCTQNSVYCKLTGAICIIKQKITLKYNKLYNIAYLAFLVL